MKDYDYRVRVWVYAMHEHEHNEAKSSGQVVVCGRLVDRVAREHPNLAREALVCVMKLPVSRV